MVNITEAPSMNNTLHNITSSEEELPQYLGFICCGISSILFGTNFIPVKKFETGDGLFFQFVFGSAMFACGVVAQIIRQSRFYSFAMLGGFFWATGNVCVVPIVKTIGLGLGICIWGSSQLLVGWVNGRFGIVGMEAEVPPNVAMNYGGVALSFISVIMYAFVKPEIVPIGNMELNVQEINSDTALDQITDDKQKDKDTPIKPSKDIQLSYVETLSPVKKKILGVVLAVVSGALYALQFLPSINIQETEKDNGASQNSLDYVFAHFSGVHLTATVYFIIYAIYRRNQPNVYPQAMVPALMSGAMVGVGTASWFVANRALSEPVSFPIISTLPMSISLLVGIIVYKEIRGRRNIIIVANAMAFTITGAVVAGFSKVK